MSKLDDYRRNADECQRMAKNARNPDDKAAWLKLANSWLLMLNQSAAGSSESQAFDAGESAKGTGQEKSEGSH